MKESEKTTIEDTQPSQTGETNKKRAAIDFATRMLQSVILYPRPAQELSFRDEIELFAVLTKETFSEGEGYQAEAYDISFNLEKLAGLVEIYEQTLNPHALEVLLSIFRNALTFSKPIPVPLVPLVQKWVFEGGIKKHRAPNPANLSRDRSLVAAILVLRDQAGIAPTRNDVSPHSESGCDIAAGIWNEIVQAKKAGGENHSFATYHVAREAWKSHRKAVGEKEGSNSPHAT